MDPIKKAKSTIKESISLSKLIEADIRTKLIWSQVDDILYDTQSKLRDLLPNQEENEDDYNKLMSIISKIDDAQGTLSNYIQVR